ncbi:DUF2946 family protein [Herbaspirillum sp. alder98]|uniref:DUF2946 family protein n=1 Tax=Herbaspirillum sp. alder98 TaxID=2913096 RepID=UPI001CD868A5|nr:DUF2946 family protein [Herbaspirillum sp. alder98]MCA1326802.1 DUF2946 family protein [Herbaspirillum sp. alder98]
MRLHPRRLRLTAWLIIACIVGMLSTGLAHALVGAPHAAPWQEICSLNGTAQRADDNRQDDAQPTHAAHCAFCSKYDHAPALLPHIDIIAPQRWRGLPPTASVLLSPPTVTAAWTHRPRGPPLIDRSRS